MWTHQGNCGARPKSSQGGGEGFPPVLCLITHDRPTQALERVAGEYGLSVACFLANGELGWSTGRKCFIDSAELAAKRAARSGRAGGRAGGVGGRGGGVGGRGRGCSSHGGSIDRGTSAGDPSSRVGLGVGPGGTSTAPLLPRQGAGGRFPKPPPPPQLEEPEPGPEEPQQQQTSPNQRRSYAEAASGSPSQPPQPSLPPLPPAAASAAAGEGPAISAAAAAAPPPQQSPQERPPPMEQQQTSPLPPSPQRQQQPPPPPLPPPAAARLQRRTGAGRLHAAGRVGRAPAAAAPLAAPKLRDLIAAARGLGAQRDDERARRRQSVEAVEALQQKAKQRKAELERRCKGLQELVLAASMDIKKLQAQAVAKRAADAQRSQAARRKQDELNEQARQLQFEEDTVAALTAKISELQSELERREDEAMGAEREAIAAMEKMQGNLDAITDQVKELTRKLGEAQAMESRARAETVVAQEAENAALDAAANARAEAVTAAAALQVAVDRERHAATAARAEAASRAEAEAAHRTLATESAAERGVIEATFRKEISVMEGEQQVLAAPGGPAAGADPAAEAGFAQTAVPGAVGAENLTLGRRLADDIMFQLDDSRVVVLGKALGKGEFGSVVQAVIYEEGSVHWRLVAAMCDLTDDITAHGFEQLLSVRPDQPDQGLLSRVAEVAAFAHGQVAATTSQLDVPGTAIAVKRFFEEKDYSKEVLVLELRAEREAAEEASQLGSDLVLRSIFVDEPTLSIGFELAASDLATILLNENGDPWGLPNAAARLLCAQVCRGVAFLHKLKIAHRDLKPANLLLTIDRDAIMRMCDGVDSVCNFVKIGDLGLCVDLVNTDHMDRDGTPFWMPPEVCRRLHYWGRRSMPPTLLIRSLSGARPGHLRSRPHGFPPPPHGHSHHTPRRVVGRYDHPRLLAWRQHLRRERAS